MFRDSTVFPREVNIFIGVLIVYYILIITSPKPAFKLATFYPRLLFAFKSQLINLPR